MVDQDLLTVFIALTASAVLIQTGILVGLYFVSTKISRQADRAVDATQHILGPVQNAVENLKAVTARLVEFTTATQHWWRRSA
jgi:hypothetical protein